MVRQVSQYPILPILIGFEVCPETIVKMHPPIFGGVKIMDSWGGGLTHCCV